jgi:glycine/D-amino acid oxidase-like deaminating enzyme
MTGASVATVFGEAGVHVALVEGALVGRGSTAASTALLLREPDVGLIGLAQRYGAAKARRIWGHAALAGRDLAETIRGLDIDCGLAQADTVYYTLDESAVGPLRQEHARRRDAGVSGTWLGAGAIRRLTAIPGRGAILTRGTAQMDPYRACLGLVRAAARSGVAVYERSPVRRIERLRAGVRVHTTAGALTAARVVIATGYATPSFRPLVGRFRLSHTYVLATEPIDEAQRREIGLAPVMLWDTERPYHYARWTRDGRLLMGGADRSVQSGSRRAAAFRAGTRELHAYFEGILPGLADVAIDRAWEGLFAETPDGLPYIGPHRRYPRHLFALGYGGNGMMFSMFAARMLLEQWLGVESPDHALYAFGRHR